MEAEEAVEILRPFGKGIMDAVRLYLPHLQAMDRTRPTREVVDELLAVREADGASERYLRDLRNRLEVFCRTFGGRPLAEITVHEIDEWLRNLRSSRTKDRGKLVSPVTRNNFRRLIGVLYGFAKGRGYCVESPVDATSKAKDVESEVGVLTVAETSRLLQNADGAIIPFIALGAFAGLRRAEIERLDWSEIDLQDNLIEVRAKKSKSARRRLVKISENLHAWLLPHARQQGPVAPSNLREELDRAREAAGIDHWPQNALRHGFASYHLAMHQDAAALALELGHTNSNLIFQHYRQIVKPVEAKRYWAIFPDRDERLLSFPSTPM